MGAHTIYRLAGLSSTLSIATLQPMSSLPLLDVLFIVLDVLFIVLDVLFIVLDVLFIVLDVLFIVLDVCKSINAT